MTDYEVGYGRPPIHTRFKKGVCPHPKGRGKRDSTEMASIIRNALSEEVEYREGRRVRMPNMRRLATFPIGGRE